MTSYNPPKKNTAFVMYVGLRSQADTRLFQVNPTLASGDAKVSKDGGSLSNLATLPSVIGSSAVVKIELSSTEMNADNVTILLSDAAGGQWCDLMINLQTAARQFDDLASQASVDAVDDYVDTEMAAVLAAVDTEIAAIKAKTDLIPASPAAVGSAMTLATDAVNATSVAASAVAEIQAGLSTLTAGQVNAEVVDALSVDTYAEPSTAPAATSSLKDKIGWLFMLARNKRLTTASADKVRNDADSGDVGTATLSDDGTTFTRGEYA
ncbi:MAG: hypothetical protein K1X50_01815 [Candidatus Promineofilum sp.]|nr:hypothetical protein [Promineifilum sp.]